MLEMTSSNEEFFLTRNKNSLKIQAASVGIKWKGLIFLFHIFFNFMHEYRINSFLNGRQDMKHAIQL